MPIYDNNGTTTYQIGKVYDFNGTTTYQIGKVYDNNGTTTYQIYTAEEPMPDLEAPEVLNYFEYHATRSGTSQEGWDLRGFERLTLEWQIGVSMSWPNAYGVSSRTILYLRMADGALHEIGEASGNLFTAGSTYTGRDTSEIDLTDFTEAQLADVHLHLVLGEMQAPASGPEGADRHAANARVYNVIAY